MSIKPLIVGLSGGSCSGKTTLARGVAKALGVDACSVLFQDNYYRDFSKALMEGKEINFDHPSSLDFDLLAQHLRALKEGAEVEVPNYDFVTHSRLDEVTVFAPKPVILVDGILILNQPQVREVLDLSFFVQAGEEVRFARRKARDVKERGREPADIERQFMKFVSPMHDQFVEPSQIYADRVLNGEGDLQGILLSALKLIEKQHETRESFDDIDLLRETLFF